MASIARFLGWLIDVQTPWAKPFGEFNKRWIGWISHRLGPLTDLLHGRWLGHPLHAATTDVPVGALTVSLVLDVFNQRPAADVALVIGILFMLLSAVIGAVDYADTDGTALTQATVHSTVMVLSLVAYLVSLAIRAGDPADRLAAVVTSVAGYGLLTIGAFVGGHVVYALGNMVRQHAFLSRGTKWQPLDLDAGTELADATPTRVRFGSELLVLVRMGETIHALHEKCAHAGGPLAKGTVVDGCLQCPWHGSRFELATGHVRRGPSVYDQPHYEVRHGDQGWEARRLPN
jgi:nitrite reductase/ring-hydroxylating ferredoxin subunit